MVKSGVRAKNVVGIESRGKIFRSEHSISDPSNFVMGMMTEGKLGNWCHENKNMNPDFFPRLFLLWQIVPFVIKIAKRC